MGSMSNDHFDPNEGFDPIIGSFSQEFDDFMFSDASFDNNVFDSGVGLPLEAVANSPGLNMILDGDAPSCEEEKDHEQNCGEGNSSRTMTKPKRDRSKTIVSERRRRSRMKEKLFELRSLVPNITKVSFFILSNTCAIVLGEDLLKRLC